MDGDGTVKEATDCLSVLRADQDIIGDLQVVSLLLSLSLVGVEAAVSVRRERERGEGERERQTSFFLFSEDIFMLWPSFFWPLLLLQTFPSCVSLFLEICRWKPERDWPA